MSSQLIFLIALVAGCSANSIIKANEASVDVPNYWKLEIDVQNTTSTRDLSSKRVIYVQGMPYLELEYATLTPISLMPVGNNGIIDDNVKKDFDVLIRAPIFPQYRLLFEDKDSVCNRNLNRIEYKNLERLRNDNQLPYSPRHLHFRQLPVWKIDVNKGWVYGFEGTIYRLLFTIRKV